MYVSSVCKYAGVCNVSLTCRRPQQSPTVGVNQLDVIELSLRHFAKLEARCAQNLFAVGYIPINAQLKTKVEALKAARTPGPRCPHIF